MRSGGSSGAVHGVEDGQDRPQPFASMGAELRWLVRLRWLAALAIVSVSLGYGLWTGWHGDVWQVLALGAGVAGYNLFFWRFFGGVGRAWGPGVAWLAGFQIALDLWALTMLTLWTGALGSPLLGLFVLHMVLGSLFLRPVVSYGVAVAAIAMMLLGLSLSGAWPQESGVALAAGGWSATLLLTVFLTTHIAENLRRQEAARREQHAQIQAILDTAADAIITIDGSGTIRSANPAAVRLFGYERSELIGRNVSILMPEPHRADHDGYLARYQRTGEARIIGIGREVPGRRKDGTVFSLDLAVSEVAGGKGRLFTGILRDITERKRAEAELRALNETLRRQQQAMIQHEKMAAMGRVAAGVAHEIANPLASLDSVLQLVHRRPERMTPQTMGAMREQIERIDRIVRELTSFAHPRGADWQRLPLDDVLAGALEMARYDHRLRRVEVLRDCAPNAAPVRVMPQALQQVLVNLILNALDAMEGTSDPRLVVRTRAEGGWHIIEIEDNGHGIAEEHIGRIFEPFYTTKPVGQGTGLGLSVSYGLIQQHGGRCEVASHPGQGTTFTIYLPEDPRAEAPAHPAPGNVRPSQFPEAGTLDPGHPPEDGTAGAKGPVNPPDAGVSVAQPPEADPQGQ